MEDVRDWFGLGESRKLEHQVKYNIASSCEMYVNCHYDNGAGATMLTRSQLIDYIYGYLQRDFTFNGTTTMNLNGQTHLNFYGKENTMKLIEQFIDNYEDVQEFIRRVYKIELYDHYMNGSNETVFADDLTRLKDLSEIYNDVVVLQWDVELEAYLY